MAGHSLDLLSAQIQCIQSRNFFDMEWTKDLLNNFMDHMKNMLVWIDLNGKKSSGKGSFTLFVNQNLISSEFSILRNPFSTYYKVIFAVKTSNIKYNSANYSSYWVASKSSLFKKFQIQGNRSKFCKGWNAKMGFGRFISKNKSIILPYSMSNQWSWL